MDYIYDLIFSTRETENSQDIPKPQASLVVNPTEFEKLLLNQKSILKKTCTRYPVQPIPRNDPCDELIKEIVQIKKKMKLETA